MNKLDATHAPELNSWAAWANVADTDFYTSIHHARAVGKMFRPDNPLLPNHEWEQRSVLEDGDTVILCGACVAPGAWRIGFGECRGTVLPAQ